MAHKRKAKGAGSKRVKKMGADISGKFGTSHNSAPFKSGPISSGPMKTIAKPPQNRPGSNLGTAGQKGSR